MKKSKFLGKFHTSNCGRVYGFLSEGKRGRGVTEGGVVEGVPSVFCYFPKILLFSVITLIIFNIIFSVRPPNILTLFCIIFLGMSADLLY